MNAIMGYLIPFFLSILAFSGSDEFLNILSGVLNDKYVLVGSIFFLYFYGNVLAGIVCYRYKKLILSCDFMLFYEKLFAVATVHRLRGVCSYLFDPYPSIYSLSRQSGRPMPLS